MKQARSYDKENKVQAVKQLAKMKGTKNEVGISLILIHNHLIDKIYRQNFTGYIR